MVCKNRGVYGFVGPSWVLITMAPRNNTHRTWKALFSPLTLHARYELKLTPGTLSGSGSPFPGGGRVPKTISEKIGLNSYQFQVPKGCSPVFAVRKRRSFSDFKILP